jgi:hypothetical protein
VLMAARWDETRGAAVLYLEVEEGFFEAGHRCCVVEVVVWVRDRVWYMQIGGSGRRLLQLERAASSEAHLRQHVTGRFKGRCGVGAPLPLFDGFTSTFMILARDW